MILEINDGVIDYNTFNKLNDEEKEYLLKPQAKKCRKCNTIYPRTKEFFYRKNKTSFISYCKSCDNRRRVKCRKKKK